MANIKALSAVFTSATLLLLSLDKKVDAATFNPSPTFKNVASYTTTLTTTNDIADIYFPNPSNRKTDNYSFPVALLLQGFNVDKSDYSNFASIVASYGFVVVVPNSRRTLPQPLQPLFGDKGLFTQTSLLNDVLAQIKIENSNPVSPIAGIVNTEKLGLLGHSAGGAVGLSAIANICLPFICEDSFNRPKELVAGAFFGANLRNQVTQEFIPIKILEFLLLCCKEILIVLLFLLGRKELTIIFKPLPRRWLVFWVRTIMGLQIVIIPLVPSLIVTLPPLHKI